MKDKDGTKANRVMRASVYAWIFIVAYAAMLPIQRLYGSFNFEQITLAVGLVIGAYIGVDGWAGIMKTGKMPAGQKYTGNRAKLESMVIATMILVIEGVLLQYLLIPVPEMNIVYFELPITELVTMSASCTAVFLGVEKGKTVREDKS